MWLWTSGMFAFDRDSYVQLFIWKTREKKNAFEQTDTSPPLNAQLTFPHMDFDASNIFRLFSNAEFSLHLSCILFFSHHTIDKRCAHLGEDSCKRKTSIDLLAFSTEFAAPSHLSHSRLALFFSFLFVFITRLKKEKLCIFLCAHFYYNNLTALLSKNKITKIL